MKHHYLTILIIFILASSCVREIKFELDEVKKNTIVIEGAITNEYQKQTIYISTLSDWYDTTRTPIKYAKVGVTSSNDSTYFYQETSPGVYTSEKPFVGITNSKYYLHIEVNDTIIVNAETSMPPVTPPDKITWKKLNNGKYILDHVAEPLVENNPAKYELFLSWQIDSSKYSAKLYYYSLTTVDIAQLFAPKTEHLEIPYGTRIVEKKYSIDDNYERYLRSLLAESSWSGGYFDEAHGNLITNIKCKNYGINTAGYFSANTVIIDTIIVK
ncbi:MAG: DUF4249 family protein [Bacteroidales bacterium]|nr:DUF4249 family protein [Bacteroidales bacterium]